MKNIPEVLVKEKNELYTPYPWIVLLDIVLSDSPGYTYRFCSNDENITFGGNEYEAFPFYLEPTKESVNGEMPSVSLRVANATQVVHEMLEELDGAVGASVTVSVVNAGYRAQNFSELSMTFTIVATEADAEWITFTLGAANLLRRRFPPFRYIAGHCNWVFKGVECAYAGVLTTCNRSFEHCHARGNTARFGGYKGLSRKGWRSI